MRLFAGFELGPMHRSDKGPKFGAPLFGVSSPFGDAGCGIQDLEGRASPHLAGPLGQIDLGEHKEHARSKITKIDVTFNAFFC